MVLITLLCPGRAGSYKEDMGMHEVQNCPQTPKEE
jgi:hypothetical protein